jgi:hypothetical protein
MKWYHETELKKMDEHLGSVAFKQYWKMNAVPPHAANCYVPLNFRSKLLLSKPFITVLYVHLKN